MINGRYNAFRLDGLGGMDVIESRDQALIIYQDIISGNDKQSNKTLWQHCHLADQSNIDWLRNDSNVPESVATALLASQSRPRTISYKDGLFISIRGMNFHPEQCVDDMISIRFWITKNTIISTYRRSLSSTSDIVNLLEKNEGPCTPVEWMASLIQLIINRMQVSIEEFDDAVITLEDLLYNSKAAADVSIQKVSVIKRQIVSLRRYLLPEMDAIKDLLETMRSPNWLKTSAVIVDEDDCVCVRESEDKLIRHIEHINAIHDRAGVLQDESARLSAEQLNKRMYSLSIITTIFLPISFIAGLLGVNLSGIPDAENPFAFWGLITLLLVIVVVQLIYLKWRKWY